MSKQQNEPPEGRSIVFLLDSGAIGGGPRNVVAAARGLQADGYTCSAICGADGPLADDLTSIGVATIALPIAGKYRFLLRFPTLVRHLLRERPATVFVYGPIAASIGGVAARLAGIRQVVYHAGYPSYYADRDPVRRVRNALVERIACSCASTVWCVSAGDRQMYAARQPARTSKLRVVPLCIAGDLLTQLNGLADCIEGRGADGYSGAQLSSNGAETLRARLGFRPNEPVVGFIGRLVPEKGVDILLRAWPRVLAARPTAQLMIVGDGPERCGLEQLAATLHISARVTFVGAQRDIVPYYALADVIAIPSRYEPGGTVALEAMAAARPVVATRVHAFADSVVDGECGRLVPPEDPTALADGLVWVLRSHEHARGLGQQGRTRALTEYTEERMAERLSRLLAEDHPAKRHR